MESKLRILVAEDNYEMREFVTSLLKAEFEVVGAVRTGRELFSKALELLPDVIVSDTAMPLLGGITAMNGIQSTGTNIPIVLISAVFRRAGISRYPGALVYVDKTDLAVDLIPAVRHAMSGQPFQSRSIPASTMKSVQTPRAARKPFDAAIVINDMDSQWQISTRTGDLSVNGCFVSTPTPFIKGQKVRVTIVYADATVVAFGRVVYAHAERMGVVFTMIEPNDRAVLDQWMSDLRAN